MSEMVLDALNHSCIVKGSNMLEHLRDMEKLNVLHLCRMQCLNEVQG